MQGLSRPMLWSVLPKIMQSGVSCDQVYNACLGEARPRLDLIRQSKPYRMARSLPPDDSQHGRARKVRFKGKNQMDTVESKCNLAGIRWREDHVEWKGLVLPGIIDPRDAVVSYALSCRVKYVRLVRRKSRGKNRFYAQPVPEGYPYQKAGHNLGEGVVGLDIGPSTIAVVGEEKAFLSRASLSGRARDGHEKGRYPHVAMHSPRLRPGKAPPRGDLPLPAKSVSGHSAVGQQSRYG